MSPLNVPATLYTVITPAYLEVVASVASDYSRFLCLHTVNHLQEVDVRVALLRRAVAKHTLYAILFLCACMCVHEHLHVCVCVSVCVCMCVCVCVRACVCVNRKQELCLVLTVGDDSVPCTLHPASCWIMVGSQVHKMRQHIALAKI